MDEQEIFSKIEIYGFSGKLGSGKNFIAEGVFAKMMPLRQTAVLALADEIKITGIVRHGLDRDKCFSSKDEHTRKVMQRIGTEEGRNVFGEDIWINYLKEWILLLASRGTRRFIITDVRFKNEFDALKSWGATMIRVDAPERNGIALEKESKGDPLVLQTISSHQSEIDLDSGRRFDYTINNDPEHNMFIQVRDLIRDIQGESKEDLVIFCDLDNTICECNQYYIIQSEKAKKIIKDNLKSKIPDDVFDDMYRASISKHNGDYARNHFILERFALSMISVFRDFEKYMHDHNSIEIENQLYQLGKEVFDFTYEKIGERPNELKELLKYGRVVLFTMGDRLEQAKKIVELGLGDLDYEIYDFKDETLFRNLMHKYPAKKYCMIGDSVDRDLVPAMNVGIDIPIKILDDKESYFYGKEQVERLKNIENGSTYHIVDGFKEIKKILDNHGR